MTPTASKLSSSHAGMKYPAEVLSEDDGDAHITQRHGANG